MILRSPRLHIYILLTLAASLALTTLAATAFGQSTPLKIGTNKQLFLGPWTVDGRDAHLVESMKNVTMTMNEAYVTGERLIVLDKPWEGTGLLDMRQFVLRDGDRFRMYYSALPYYFVTKGDLDPSKQYRSLWGKPHQRILCYAESKDGIRWEKPNLGLYSWEGSRQNNILFPNDDFKYPFSEIEGAWVFIDPNAKSSAEEYKMMVKISPIRKPQRGKRTAAEMAKPKSDEAGLERIRYENQLVKGQYTFTSPDGIHWKLVGEDPVPVKHNDTQFSVFWDEALNKYVAYTRRRRQSPAQEQYYQKKYGFPGRSVVLVSGRLVSDDFLHWSDEDEYYWEDPSLHPIVTISPDAIDQANSPYGLTRMDFYGPNVTKYTEAPNAYIALPNAYYHWKFDMTRKWWRGIPVQLPSTMDVQLLTSRDGIRWHRTPNRKPFIRLGRKGTFWSSTLWPSNVIRVKDELWIFFAGLDVSHKEQSLVESHGARGRAILRLDGFISADAAYTGGELTTKPLIFSGRKLQFNVDTSAGGTVQLEVQDRSGKPITGFAAEDADEVNGNYLRVAATWNSSEDVTALAGKPVKLRFVMRDAKLYSFQFLP